ncbi:MAG: co-chaperone GroES [Candidatus Dojkabacteria bacterium]|nr:co-chaperone GroES [Candidatus Dojkabacteria bacterium]
MTDGVKIKLNPVGEYILVKPIDDGDTTTLPSGLLIQKKDTPRPQRGIVLAIGQPRDEKGNPIHVPFSVGQKVIFRKYAPEEFEIDGEQYLLMKFSDVIAVIEEDENKQ